MTLPGNPPQRVAILSDVHSNLHALRAVLDALPAIGKHLEDVTPARGSGAPAGAEDRGQEPDPATSGNPAKPPALEELDGLDGLVLLGDLVGYNAYPAECLKLLRNHPHVAIRGNHDDAAVRDETRFLNIPAAAGVKHSRARVGGEGLAYLQDLPEERTLRVGDITLDLYHGSPYDPLHEYIYPHDGPRLLRHEAEARSERAPNLILLGHTHVPMGYLRPDATKNLPSTEFLAPPNLPNPEALRTIPPEDGAAGLPHEVARLDLFGPAPIAVANPGSVGQPRDGDPRAAFAILDGAAQRLTYHRVTYDVEAAQAANRDAGLPTRTSERLQDGW